MVDYWLTTKVFFKWTIISLFFSFLGWSYIGLDMGYGALLTILLLILISMSLAIMTIVYGIKSLKNGIKKAWILIIISAIVPITFLIFLIITITS